MTASVRKTLIHLFESLPIFVLMVKLLSISLLYFYLQSVSGVEVWLCPDRDLFKYSKCEVLELEIKICHEVGAHLNDKVRIVMNST